MPIETPQALRQRAAHLLDRMPLIFPVDPRPNLPTSEQLRLECLDTIDCVGYVSDPNGQCKPWPEFEVVPDLSCTTFFPRALLAYYIPSYLSCFLKMVGGDDDEWLGDVADRVDDLTRHTNRILQDWPADQLAFAADVSELNADLQENWNRHDRSEGLAKEIRSMRDSAEIWRNWRS